MKTTTGKTKCNYSYTFEKPRCKKYIASFQNIDLQEVEKLSKQLTKFTRLYLDQVQRKSDPLPWAKVAEVFTNEKLRNATISGDQLKKREVLKALSK